MSQASSWLVNQAHDKVLMIYHNIYHSWAWTGGDADGDGTLTLGDALAIMRTAIGVAPEFGDNIGDMNANGDINLDDAITLARICIGVY